MLGRRCSNEDAHALLLPCSELGDGVAWCGVFDGHGGAGVSAFTAAHLHEAVAAQLRAANALQPPTAVVNTQPTLCSMLGRALADEDVDMRGDGASSSSTDSCASNGAQSPVPGEPRVERAISSASAASSGISIGVGSAASCDTHMGGQSRHTQEDESGTAADNGKGDVAQGSADVLSASPETVARAFSRGYIDFDIRLYHELYNTADPEESGTTALVAMVTATKLVVANTGDSRAVMCRRGKAVRLSEGAPPPLPQHRNRARMHACALCAVV